MKKFRLTDNHLIILGLVLAVVLAMLVGSAIAMPVKVAIICLVIGLLVGLMIYQRSLYLTDEITTIQQVNQQAEGGLVALLEKLPVGVIKINVETDEIEWFNPFAELIFTQNDGNFDYARLKEVITVGLDQSKAYAKFADKQYVVHTDEPNGLLYFFDASAEYQTSRELTGLRPAIGIVSVDNYDDLEDTISESDLSQVNSFVANFVAEFSDQHQIFYRRVSKDRFYLFTDYAVLSKLMDSKFALINDFREQASERELSLTLSVGFAFGSEDHNDIGQLALQNLNMAEVRGGDQAVVKENVENKPLLFFGGNTATTVKRTRTRTRAMMTAISDKIKSANQVFIVGHRNLDMDALGATVGMQCFAENIIDNVYAVYDDSQMAPDISRAIERLKDETEGRLLTVKEATERLTDNDLLIMVDHSKTNLTLSKSFYEKFSQVIVVDHHRCDSDFPENALIAYIESGASSASELVTELLQFQNGKKKRLTRLQASLLMAGLMLDTHQFTSRVTSRTFDVASYLRSSGSDSVVIQDISATEFDEYREISELILKSKRILPNIVISKGEEDKVYSNVVTAKVADDLLKLAGIEASFVITRNQNDEVVVSARSTSKINVQRIMEEMGGGGHFNLAATQITDSTIEQVFKDLREKVGQSLAADKEV